MMNQRRLLRFKNCPHGFTLIELMVVIVILGILALYVAPKIMGRPDEAKQVKARMDIASLETAIKLYRLDNGFYPSTEQGLAALVQMPQSGQIPKRWKEGGYLEKKSGPQGPLGQRLRLSEPGQPRRFRYHLLRRGRGRRRGGQGPGHQQLGSRLIRKRQPGNAKAGIR